MAARYGSKQHPDSVLLTPDKRSGLNLVKYYELWNEPNLNPSPTAAWGGWAAPMDKYYEMMRFGAEAVKRADPDAVVTSAGYAGMSTGRGRSAPAPFSIRMASTRWISWT